MNLLNHVWSGAEQKYKVDYKGWYVTKSAIQKLLYKDFALKIVDQLKELSAERAGQFKVISVDDGMPIYKQKLQQIHNINNNL